MIIFDGVNEVNQKVKITFKYARFKYIRQGIKTVDIQEFYWYDITGLKKTLQTSSLSSKDKKDILIKAEELTIKNNKNEQMITRFNHFINESIGTWPMIVSFTASIKDADDNYVPMDSPLYLRRYNNTVLLYNDKDDEIPVFIFKLADFEFLFNSGKIEAVDNNTTNENINIDTFKQQIESILEKILSGFFWKINEFKMLDQNVISVNIAANNVEINRVQNQYPQRIVFNINTNDMSVYFNSYVYRKPNKDNPSENYFVMKGIKIPFRKPQQNETAILKALEKCCILYKEALIANKDNLMYQDIVDYNALLGQ